MQAVPNTPASQAIGSPLSDWEVVQRVRGGEAASFELLMRRYNQKVYRAVRSFLRDAAEAEDVMQQAWLSAYRNLGQFHGDAAFSTWVVHIAINEALGNLRRRTRLAAVEEQAEEDGAMRAPISTPEDRTGGRELASLLEEAVDQLPPLYRSAFVLREVEGLSTAEAAEALGVGEDVVKTRLHRAKGLLREALYARAGSAAAEIFHFGNERCDRVVAAVLAKIGAR